MALVNRKPFGSLNHTSLYVPQDEAFLSLIRNAKRSVFIQTPDLNAVPLLPALAEAVSRGVEVTYYVCLGYNDSGELLPGQGGTNEMAAKKIFDSLRTEEEIRRLHVHFYVAADQDHPINNKFKQRSCHIKLLIVDESVAIQGSGNQDTQSWFQSQEVNVMVDSPLVCEAWREAIERNQNTRQYGKARKDGCWYDEQGVLAEGSLGSEVGKFAWAKGIKGAVGRVTGHGGF
jgi:phosphatidylserine/phosphatidylglycerophosphate/cardiolipin synthase-like enzyme